MRLAGILYADQEPTGGKRGVIGRGAAIGLNFFSSDSAVCPTNQLGTGGKAEFNESLLEAIHLITAS